MCKPLEHAALDENWDILLFHEKKECPGFLEMARPTGWIRIASRGSALFEHLTAALFDYAAISLSIPDNTRFVRNRKSAR